MSHLFLTRHIGDYGKSGERVVLLCGYKPKREEFHWCEPKCWFLANCKLCLEKHSKNKTKRVRRRKVRSK